MKLVGKVPVEPLSEERLTNIERNLVVRASELAQRPAGFRAPRRALAFAGIAMAVALAAFVGWSVRGGDANQGLGPKSEQLTMTAGALDLGDAQIEGADFVVTRTSGRVEVVMQQPGHLKLHVDHKPGRLFVVRAGAVEIEDVGTEFSVDYDGNNVEVRVTEGEVKVKHAGKEIAIVADNAWTIEIGPITIAALQAKRAAQVTAAAPTANATQPDPNNVVAVAPATNVDSGSAAQANPDSGHGSASSGTGQGSGRKAGTTNARKALDKAMYDDPPPAGTDDPKAAIATYLERVRKMPEGEDKQLMLYGIAVMQHRLKQDNAARYTISGVLKRQGGPAYEAALWLNVRINCLKAFDDECRIAAEKYIAKFDSGVHAGVAQEILKEISRGQ